MAGSFSKELEDLLNPLPKFADPEDDADDATKARVVEKFEEDDGEDVFDLGALRKRNSSLLSDADKRYVGKPVSRKQLLVDDDMSEEEDDEEEDEGSDLEEGEEEDLTDDEVGGEDEQFLDSELELTSESKKLHTLPEEVDFYKMTDGMDELGVSEDEDDEDELEESGRSNEDEDSVDDEMEDDQDENTIQTFSQGKVDEEVEKGLAVKNQLALWDQLLEGRIKLQKALVTANQLPQPPTFPHFKQRGGAEFTSALKNSHKALKALQRSLLELHEQLLKENPDTRSIAEGGGGDEEINGDEEEIPAQDGVRKRKLEMAEYPVLMAKRFAAFEPYRDGTLQRWHDKTRLALGKGRKGFGAFDRNIVTQVEQVLMDKERLLRRTQTRRSDYRILGKREAPAAPSEAEDAEQRLRANTHLKDLDEDIFDDDDFYHQLLRELIERKTSAADPNDQVAMGRQWLAIQKLRSKIKKKVDTKASKGRKVRFHVHSKLVSFMAPVEHSAMSDEARSELYRALFGQRPSVRE